MSAENMPKIIPWEAAQRFAEEFGLSHVVILCTEDGTSTDHVVTFGQTTLQSSQAAEMGNLIKDALGWPKELHANSARATRLCQAAEDFVGNVDGHHISNSDEFIADESYRELDRAVKAKA